MAETSAGILMYRRVADGLQVLLIHFGGPYWARKDVGAWGIPKGGIEAGEDAETAAIREFTEELGSAPSGLLRPLPRIRQQGGKWVVAFALEGDFDASRIESNLFTMEWPPRSGEMRSFPEVDRAEWFALDEARRRMLPSQTPLLDALEALLNGEGRPLS